MFATDYPHWDFDTPAQSIPRGLSKEGRAKLSRARPRSLRPADARRSRMTVATVTEAVDCDLHVAPAGVDTLLPYLDEYWRSYIDDATIRMGQAAYPMGAATTGAAPAGNHEELTAVLDETRPRRAILSCLALDGVHRNPHYGAAIATAINTGCATSSSSATTACARAWPSPRWTSRLPSRRSSAGTVTGASPRSSCRCATTSRTATATTTRCTRRRTSAACRSRCTRGAGAGTRRRRPASRRPTSRTTRATPTSRRRR